MQGWQSFCPEIFLAIGYNILSLHACTVIGNNTGIVISTRDYPPGDYNAIFNFTDIYGQSDQRISGLFLTCMLSSLLETKL